MFALLALLCCQRGPIWLHIVIGFCAQEPPTKHEVVDDFFLPLQAEHLQELKPLRGISNFLYPGLERWFRLGSRFWLCMRRCTGLDLSPRTSFSFFHWSVLWFVSCYLCPRCWWARLCSNRTRLAWLRNWMFSFGLLVLTALVMTTSWWVPFSSWTLPWSNSSLSSRVPLNVQVVPFFRRAFSRISTSPKACRVRNSWRSSMCASAGKCSMTHLVRTADAWLAGILMPSCCLPVTKPFWPAACRHRVPYAFQSSSPSHGYHWTAWGELSGCMISTNHLAPWCSKPLCWKSACAISGDLTRINPLTTQYHPRAENSMRLNLLRVLQRVDVHTRLVRLHMVSWQCDSNWCSIFDPSPFWEQQCLLFFFL